MSLSVVIPTLNAARTLPACLNALADGAVDGLVREVIVSDGGSIDETTIIADSFGARIVASAKGRGAQLHAGTQVARSAYILFLHADTVLQGDWIGQIRHFMEHGDRVAAVFGLRFDDRGLAPALVAGGAMIRTRIFKAPYGDQGLLISRQNYAEIGGYRDMPLFEDVDLIRRIRRKYGREAVMLMRAYAITSADRYRADGYFRRVIRNFICIAMYRLGRSPEKIVSFYQCTPSPEGEFMTAPEVSAHRGDGPPRSSTPPGTFEEKSLTHETD